MTLSVEALDKQYTIHKTLRVCLASIMVVDI